MALFELLDSVGGEDGGVPLLEIREQLLRDGLEEVVSGATQRTGSLMIIRGVESADDSGSLTFGDVVANNGTFPEQSLEYLPGFEKSFDPEANLTLQEGHLAMLKRYLRTGQAANLTPSYLGSYPVKQLDRAIRPWFNIQKFRALSHPSVEGNIWFAGNLVRISDASSAIIFVPWVNLRKKGGSPFPVLYTKGYLSPTKLVEITKLYNQYMTL